MIEIKDEILTGEPRYRVRDNNGNIIQDNVTIEQITPVKQEGTEINKGLIEGIQQKMFEDTSLLVAEYTSTEELKEIKIEGLDIDADGGVYDVLLSVYGDDDYFALKCNEGIYTLTGFKHTSSINAEFSTQLVITKTNKVVGIFGIATAGDSEVIGKNFEATENITSITFFKNTDLNNKPIGVGCNIKIYKRR